MDILKDKWSPALQVRTVLLSIQALLSAPNPDGMYYHFIETLKKKKTHAHKHKQLHSLAYYSILFHFCYFSNIFFFKIFFISLFTRVTDPLANDVAEHWKSNEKAAIATGISLTFSLSCFFPLTLPTSFYYLYSCGFFLYNYLYYFQKSSRFIPHF